jgi:hypothetical protein
LQARSLNEKARSHAVGVKQDIARAKVYMARTNRRIEKQRYLIGRSRNAHTVPTARDLVEVLTALLANVEHRHQHLQDQAR